MIKKLPRDPKQRAMALALYILMSNISEDFWAASWYVGIEYALWADIQGDKSMGLSPEEKEMLQYVSSEAGGWIYWGRGPTYIPTLEWVKKYQAEITAQKLTNKP